jgi:hypothetical protein
MIEIAQRLAISVGAVTAGDHEDNVIERDKIVRWPSVHPTSALLRIMRVQIVLIKTLVSDDGCDSLL